MNCTTASGKDNRLVLEDVAKNPKSSGSGSAVPPPTANANHVSKNPAINTTGNHLAEEEETTSESENDPIRPSSTSSGFQRKLSTNKDIRNAASLKEGYLMKQTSSFQRWHRRYFKVKGHYLYYAKNENAQIFDEISLTELTIAESSTKTFKHCFQVITPYRVLMLAAESRSVMNEWVHAIRASGTSGPNFYDGADSSANLLTCTTGAHVWYATSHARPTYCNVCREQLCGVTSQGLSCEICKFKAHKRCAVKALNNCKWTTLASMGKDIIEEADGSLSLPHQWLEGNLPVHSKCEVCERTCGSVLRLQDWRCLWCRATVHSGCRSIFMNKCRLGRISVVPPTALHTVGSDDAWESSRALGGCSPLLVFVNSRSGDHQGIRFLRRFKQLLNPAQVFDLMNGGPRLGLQLFRHFEPFRILVCGGDGSAGWVMSEIDRLDMHRQCQVGILPLGTGNDLARVLGWGASCDDDTHLPMLLEKYEKATTKMLDRWSVMTFERGVILKPALNQDVSLRESRTSNKAQIAEYEDSVVSHLQNILQSDQHQTVITSAKVLCETVRDMIGKIDASPSSDSEIDEKCAALTQKLDSLLQTLNEESETCTSVPDQDESELQDEHKIISHPAGEDISLSEQAIEIAPTSPLPKKLTQFRRRETLMSRANSLKKAVRQIIEHVEKAIDEQTQTTTPPVVVVRPLSLAVVAPTEHDEEFSDVGYSKMKSGEESGTKLASPIDLHVTLPAPTPFADKSVLLESVSPLQNHSEFSEANDDWSESKVLKDHKQSEKIGFHRTASIHSNKTQPIKIEVDSPSTSSATRTPISEMADLLLVESDMSSSVTCASPDEIMYEKSSLSPPPASTTYLTVPNSGPSSPNIVLGSSSSSSNSNNLSRGTSPRASRRVSMGSIYTPLEVEIPKSPNAKHSIFELPIDSQYFLSSPSSHSNSPSPNKSLDQKRKTLPIVNPLVSHPQWPFNSNSSSPGGGIVSKVLLANADTICAVASPLMDIEDDEDLMIGFNEKCVLNNYFGIGIDAKITLDFHLKREEHPEKCKSRTKNFMWYGVLGSKEYVQQTCKNLEQRVQLECDGKRIPLPSLQGIVILNIQSFMGGTNFWGSLNPAGCFLAPSFDDKILEVVAVFDSMQMAASRLIKLQHHRIAQCNSVTITIFGDADIPIQVDGEAWLQPPGVIKIVHKNRMQMLCRNRALESSLKSWEEKQKHHTTGLSPTSTEVDDLDKKRHSKRLFTLRKLKSDQKTHHKRTDTDSPDIDGPSNEFSDETSSSRDGKPVEAWTGTEVGEWLDFLQLGEYKSHFLRHDVQGAELLTLQRRDLKELGIRKVGHIKRILQGIDKLQRQQKRFS